MNGFALTSSDVRVSSPRYRKELCRIIGFPVSREIAVKNSLRAIVAAALITGLSAAPVLALNSMSGMPREPISKAGKCAKANHGVHIPYRGWRTKDRLGWLTCMWW